MILQKPIMSEKSMKLAGAGEYTFLVGKDAQKPEIAKAVAEQFKVTVLAVKTANIKGEVKMQKRARRSYLTAGFKKAVVKVKRGQLIPIFESPKDEVTVTTGEGEPQVLKEKRNFLGRTKVRVEKTGVGAAPSTQRKVITGK